MSKNTTIGAKEWKKAIISAANNLTNSKSRIDSLNVFPVPDGDTGSNMSSTINQAKTDLQKQEFEKISDVANTTAKSMLMGARGNSGVILSQIFKGFSIAFEGKKNIDTFGLLVGFREATKKAYASVLKPVEGTILSVIRETTEALEKFKNSDVSIVEFMKNAVDYARVACENTPKKLAVLREVGVNDSGGEGLFLIIEGMYLSFKGKDVAIRDTEEKHSFISDTEIYDGEFGYCTEFIVDLKDVDGFSKNDFVEIIEKEANSLVVINDVNILKVHGHTIKPGNLLNIAQKYGEFIKIKVDNMSLQANESKNNSINGNKDKKECGIVSCNLGQGIIRKVKELGCDYVVESGQTQNPSTTQIIEAIHNTNAKTVFVLPNNSNIILTAQQAAQTITDKKVIIIPTKTQVQGLTALMYFNNETSAEENKELMLDSIKSVRTGQVTKAVRDTKLNGLKITQGDYLSIIDNKIVNTSNTYIDAAKHILDKTVDKQSEIVTIYYGDEVSKIDAKKVADYILLKFDVEVEIINGGQPNYQFVMGVE
ncbi:dihydroxyacetone (glycerone) kinase, DhaK2 subunit [Mycoplasmopsis californica]|uniref:DAK2 domain-containing protein n=1 Tax=Mycoplasmopsis equigenitalium TaxID=114883 RepID=A0ABY5J4R2_9BACT|nr:DAK2 domain-containing protein [Mycoplasmopsis equigenitalium]UUD36876.1 DAK2 domain-containing protein [Mycoplasmopsis equigenitalium]VEU69829.1 dihydroxyacetone (glycerone) kinase, DhaK2 subunit [Mycoplasmopsis californica]